MSQKTYLNILKFGVYLSLITVFFVFRGLLFPFITSKQISFNILIEILLVFWLALIIKYPAYRPKKNWVTIGLTAFLAIITLSCFTGVDFNLSFWGDVERMLGVFHVLHFYALYLIIISVFREWKDWKFLFIFSVVLACFESYIALTVGTFFYGTIGNTAYVAGYLIFNIYFALLLFLKEKNKGLRWLHLLVLPLLIATLLKVNISGATVGLGFSFIFFLFLYGLLHKNKKVKAATLTICFLASSFVLYVFILQRDNVLTRNSQFWENIVNDVNIKKGTFQTRLVSWRAAGKDFKNHPLLGTGFGNYAVTFDKHFDPHFYDYSRGETYFDRAHNNVIDIGSTAGILGLIAYFSIFAAVGFYMLKAYFKDKIFKTHEFVLLAGLLTAYFVQNLAVFDSLVTYIGFMIILGYVVWRTRERDEDEDEEDKEDAVSRFGQGDYYMIGGLILFSIILISQDKIKFLSENNMRTLWLYIGLMAVYIIYEIIKGNGNRREEGDRELENNEIFTIFGVGVLIFVIMFQFNIKPLKMLLGTIDGQRYSSAGDTLKTLESYRKALDYNTVLDRDSRTSLIRLFAGQPDKFKALGPEEGARALDFVIRQAELNVEYNRGDSLNQMIYAQILNTAATYYQDQKDKFAHYSDRALEAIDMAIQATPGRTPVYFQKAQFLISRGDQEGALEVLKETTTHNENYYESFCHLGKTYLFYKNEAEGYNYIGQCIDKGGAHMLTPASLLKSFINHYASAEDWPRVIKLYEALTSPQIEGGNARAWIDLAKLYAQSGEKEKAINAANKVVELDPGAAQYAQEFIANVDSYTFLKKNTEEVASSVEEVVED